VTGVVQRRRRCLTLDTGASYGAAVASSAKPRNRVRFASKRPQRTPVDARTCKVWCKVKRCRGRAGKSIGQRRDAPCRLLGFSPLPRAPGG
jgi:hypothetical protein